MVARRNQRAGVADRWRNRDGTPSSRNGTGKRWLARYVGPDGRERTKAHDRKVDAQRWLDQQTSDLVTGRWVDPERSAVTFGTIAETWFKTKAHRAPKTIAGYRSILDHLVLPRWAAVPLREIRYEDVQTWIADLSAAGSHRFDGKGLSASRVRQAHQLAGAVLKFAVRSGYIPANPAEDIDLPRLPESEHHYLTHEALHALAAEMGRFSTLTLTLGYCGIRFGEAVALTVGDVSPAVRRLRVARSVTHVADTGRVEGPPKNHQARTVPMPAFLADILGGELAGRDPAALVFPGRDGGWLSLGEYRWPFDPAADAIGEPGLTPKQLRHTAASLAISAGANVKVVQRMLGHKTATMTLDRYGHLFPDDLDAVAGALNDAALRVLRTDSGLSGSKATHQVAG